jgi:hypothetical protein
VAFVETDRLIRPRCCSFQKRRFSSPLLRLRNTERMKRLLTAFLLCLFAMSTSADEQQSAARPLPRNLTLQLERWGCRIDGPIRGEFAQRGQTDWAVLCDKDRLQTILIFWKGSELTHAELGNRFNGDGAHLGVRKIRSVGRMYIIGHYRAREGEAPPHIEHDGIGDIFEHSNADDIPSTSVVHYYYQGRWIDFEMQE